MSRVRLTVVPTSQTVTLEELTIDSEVTGGNDVTGTVTLSGPAPAGGASVVLSGSRSGVAAVPASVTVPQGATSTDFVVETMSTNYPRGLLLTASYNHLVRTDVLVVNGGEQLRSVQILDASARDAEVRAAPRAVEAQRPAVRAEATRNAFRSPTTTSGEPKRRFYIYTPELHLLAETELTADATPEMEYEYVWFGGEPVAQIETGTGAAHYYFNDHLGTPILTTDATGVVDWRVEREPYGEILEVRAGADRHQPLAFPGQEEDGGEIAYNIFRWYRAGWGRYTQADPIEPTIAIVTTNMYSYALANPYGNTDPLGLFTVMSLASPGQRKLIEDAMKLLRDEMAKHPCADCKSYFAAQTHPDFTDIDVWSQPGGPPYVQVIPRPSNAGTARAHTQSGGSFLWTWLYTSNFPPSALMPCDLASLILHEAGHLSRKDTTDNEPPDFFTKCKFGCINPGKWH